MDYELGSFSSNSMLLFLLIVSTLSECDTAFGIGLLGCKMQVLQSFGLKSLSSKMRLERSSRWRDENKK